jgi:hypothetical protein
MQSSLLIFLSDSKTNLFINQKQIIKFDLEKKGLQFTRLTLTGNYDIRKKGKYKIKYYECICQCETIKWIQMSHLKANVKSCGCYNRDKMKKYNKKRILDLTNKRFGKLVAIKLMGKINDIYKWLCQCDCGNQILVKTGSLNYKEVQSCGCLQKEKTTINNQRYLLDLKGKRFGKLVVLYRSKNKGTTSRVTWCCQCDCGTICYILSHDLQRGSTKSCGCLKNIRNRKGRKWEKLVKKYLKLYYPIQFYYQKRLPNNKIPDFSSYDNNIIIDTKLNDYTLSIDSTIKKYYSYCNELIICCLFHKRKDWQTDFIQYPKVQFWYLDDLLTWIPLDQHATFLQEITNIKNLKKIIHPKTL